MYSFAWYISGKQKVLVDTSNRKIRLEIGLRSHLQSIDACCSIKEALGLGTDVQ
jgi:hypothetical protein